MARRIKRYFEKPHVMDPDIERRFREIIERGKKEKLPLKSSSPLKPRWQLWRWDTLEDVDQGD